MGTGIIGMLVIGFLAGLVARAIKPGDDKMGCFLTAGLGIAGSFVAGFLGSSLGWYQQGEPVGFVASVIGAIIILVIFGLVSKK
ncbi:GlsB/YeaQ/YmgE family stress response membrane protein [Suttonella ornithocola]|uniref:Transglycosylase associated protein n=1 Tax=Suttonella ornithocola TaxID=279832 RepID=A0A380MQC3_9GAMM|nr:GlsB/YeaQ/YmgE family stress response membrane protein [Suttonella ornithocola]SUO93911.1 Transglycosylase associated protein [Suttonella ornithocola]